MENSCGENWFWWCLTVISAVCGCFFAKLYNCKIIGEYILKKILFVIITMQIILGLKYHIIPRHRSHCYCFKGFVITKIECLIFPEDLKNFGVKRITVLSLNREVVMDPIALGRLCLGCLSTHTCTHWFGFRSDWGLLMTEMFCFGITSPFSSFNFMSAVWKIPEWCWDISYSCLLIATC